MHWQSSDITRRSYEENFRRYNLKDAMMSLPLPLAAFFAGLISFLSPCVLPLVPGYLSLISGAGLEELKAPQAHLMRRVMVNSVGFILGFSVVLLCSVPPQPRSARCLGCTNTRWPE